MKLHPASSLSDDRWLQEASLFALHRDCCIYYKWKVCAGNKMLLITYRYLLVGAQVGKDWKKLLGDCKNGRDTKVTTDGIFNKSKNELSSSNLKIVLMKLLLAESGITTCLWCPTTSEVLLIQKKKKTEHIPGAISCKAKSVEGYHLLQHAAQLYKNKKLIK